MKLFFLKTWENIDKYIDQKLSEKDSQNDLVKENEADKD